ncbi:hypothetical protein [Metabacillus arenae]|uniref:Uncharacterized protein n=1 Tax=Metabacillus arenae TaxID=2771434 RepID=A0A926NGG3_9BACI|nr:hypothetical protein [Metabacillus arenae]MBD1382994.1 hypothetical protein [Metabacillus arenae]
MSQKLQEFIKTIENKSLLIILSLYSITFGLLVTNNGLFWDDWTVHNVENKGLEQQFGENGYLTFLWLLKALNSLFGNEVTALRIITFLSYLFSAIFLYFVLKKIKEIDSWSRLFIVLIFMLFPVNFARVSIVNANHAMNYFFFFFGFLLLMKYLSNKRIITRIISLSLFFLSFFTPSFLVIYLTIVFYIFHCEKVNILNIRQASVTVLKYIDFILLPIIYWIIKKVFIKTTGHYANYNELSLENFMNLPSELIRAFKYSYIEPILISIPKSVLWGIFFSIIWLVLFFVFKKSLNVFKEKINVKVDVIFFLLGFVFFVLGVFAYAAVGKTPSPENWNSRQQLLVPLGASFITYFLVRLIAYLLNLGNNFRNIIFTLFLALFITSNISIYFDYHRDWMKQLSIMENFKDSSIIQNNTTFVFDDNTAYLNTLNRNYRFYEYTGLFEKTFHEETRIGVSDPQSLKSRSFRSIFKYEFVNVGGYTLTEPQYTVHINRGNYELSIMGTINLFFNKVFNKEQFNEDLKNVIDLQYSKM